MRKFLAFREFYYVLIVMFNLIVIMPLLAFYGAKSLYLLSVSATVITLLEFYYKRQILNIYRRISGRLFIDTKIIYYDGSFEQAYWGVDHSERFSDDENAKNILRVVLDRDYRLMHHPEYAFSECFFITDQQDLSFIPQKTDTILYEGLLLSGKEGYIDLRFEQFTESGVPLFTIHSIPAIKEDHTELDKISEIRQLYEERMKELSEKERNFTNILSERERQIAQLERERDLARANAELVLSEKLLAPDTWQDPSKLSISKTLYYLLLIAVFLMGSILLGLLFQGGVPVL